MGRVRGRSGWGLPLRSPLQWKVQFPPNCSFLRKPALFLMFCPSLMAPRICHLLILNFFLFWFSDTSCTLKTWGGNKSETIPQNTFWLFKVTLCWREREILKKSFILWFPAPTFPPYLGRELSQGQNVLNVAEAKNKSNFLHLSTHIPSKKIQKAGKKQVKNYQNKGRGKVKDQWTGLKYVCFACFYIWRTFLLKGNHSIT